MIIQKVIKKDSLDIWLWRNDKATIFFSKNRKKINFQSHTKWLRKILLNPKIKFYMGFLLEKNKEKKKVGVVRFNIKNQYALISINLNPAMRGKKMSYVLLAGAINKFLKFKKIKLIAEIKNNNLASINCFLRNKFYFLKSKKKHNVYQRLLG